MDKNDITLLISEWEGMMNSKRQVKEKLKLLRTSPISSLRKQL